MYRAFHYPPGRERLHAVGALDLALWDLKGKALGVPVYELLGGLNRNHVECYTTTFRGGGNTLRERAAACMEAGWRLFRFDAASLPPGSASYDARDYYNVGNFDFVPTSFSYEPVTRLIRAKE